MSRSKGFNWRIWMILGGALGAAIGYVFGVEHDYSSFVTILTTAGGMVAGSACLTFFMLLSYASSRMDIFGGE